MCGMNAFQRHTLGINLVFYRIHPQHLPPISYPRLIIDDAYMTHTHASIFACAWSGEVNHNSTLVILDHTFDCITLKVSII